MTNQLIIIGRLTRAAQLRSTGDKARATFTIAVDGYNGKTEFLPVTVFGRTAETVAEFTDKGNLVCVEGRITSGKYTNDAGETVYTLDVIDARVGFISKPRNATATPDSVDPDADTETA